MTMQFEVKSLQNKINNINFFMFPQFKELKITNINTKL